MSINCYTEYKLQTILLQTINLEFQQRVYIHAICDSGYVKVEIYKYSR